MATHMPPPRLFATAPRAEPHRLSSGIVSLGVHLAAGCCLVLLGMRSHLPVPDEHVEQVTFLDVRATPPTPPAEPVRIQATAPPRGFQTLSSPTSVPAGIPAPDSGATREADYSGEGREGGVATGVPGPAAPVEPAAPTTYDLSEVSVPPRMTTVVKPHYSDDLITMGIHGTVLIGVDILPTGEPDGSSIRVVKSLNPMLDDAAVKALLQSRFSPAYVGTRPVRVAAVVPYAFRSR
jgi:TonB family protein